MNTSRPYIAELHPRLHAQMQLLAMRCSDSFERVFQGDRAELARLEGRLALTPRRPELQARADALRLSAANQMFEAAR